MSCKNKRTWQRKQIHSAEYRHFASWLCDRRSLTARLQARGSFAVRSLRQGLATPTFDEAVFLGIKPGRLAWVREVALLCNGKPVVFAHTVLPWRPRGPLTGWLARLGNRSLGALVFANAGFKRGELHSRRLDQRHELFHAAIDAMQLSDDAPKTLWARRSRFSYGAQSALVTEVFSPTLGEN
jgi:chorismate--pyruvate lyase